LAVLPRHEVRPNKRLQPSAARGAVPDRDTLVGVNQASQRGCGAASAAEAPSRYAARMPSDGGMTSSDPWATITEASAQSQADLGDILELRAADPQQQAMLRSYLSDVRFPPGAQVLEVGCGTGAVTRALSRWPDVADVVGLDPSPVLLDEARQHDAGRANTTFSEGDGRRLAFPDGRFDVVVMHTLLCHVPDAERCVSEATRVLRAGGQLAIFDNDVMTMTVATSDVDPLQTCVAALVATVHNPWLTRRLPQLVQVNGLGVERLRSFGYVETREGYFLTVVDRGAELLLSSGKLSAREADDCKREARERIAAGSFFGHMAYASVIAGKRQ